jgi:hypothetical protein
MDGCIFSLLRGSGGIWGQNMLDEATKMPLILVTDVDIQPAVTALKQLGGKGNSFVSG